MGAGANPAGAGGNAEFDDYCPAPKKEQSQESKTYDSSLNSQKKKKQATEQCELDENVKDAKIEIVYRALVREAERAGRKISKQFTRTTILGKSKSWNRNRKWF